MTIPFVLWILLILLGVVGSLATFIGLIITFFQERSRGNLW